MIREAEKGTLKSNTGRAFSGTRRMLMSLEQCWKNPLGLVGSPKQKNLPGQGRK